MSVKMAIFQVLHGAVLAWRPSAIDQLAPPADGARSTTHVLQRATKSKLYVICN